MAIAYFYFNFSIKSPVIFVFLSNEAFKVKCTSLRQSDHIKKFVPWVFTKEDRGQDKCKHLSKIIPL